MNIRKRRLSCSVFIFAFLLLGAHALATENELISKNDSGTAGNSHSIYPSISADGRYVTFNSTATNLVPGTTGGRVYLRDRLLQTIEVVGSGAGAAISGDGRYVAFTSAGNIYVRDRTAGTTEAVSVSNNGQLGNMDSGQAAISGDGRYVAFTSNSFNLPGAIYGHFSLFFHDRETHTTQAISAGNYYDNGSYPAFSGDGRYVVYLRNENIYSGYGVYQYDLQAGTTVRVGCAMAVDHGGIHKFRPAVSYDGRYIAFPSECETAPNGQAGYSSIQVFYFDMQTGTKEVISLDSADNFRAGPNNFNFYISMDYSGRFVAFVSYNNLVPEDTNGVYDVYLRDTVGGSTTLVSRNYNGGNLSSGGATLGYTSFSGDGSVISFTSQSLDIVYPPPGSIPFQNIYVAGNPLAALNTPPVVEAGSDQHITCAGAGGAFLTLDGSGSSDSDGDALTYEWTVPGIGVVTGVNPAITLPPGIYTITLTVDDGKGGSHSDTVQITIEGDTILPQSTIMVSGTLGNNGWYRSPVEVTLAATDNCSVKEIRYSINGDQETVIVQGDTATFTLSDDGIYEITYRAVDKSGNSEVPQTLTIKIDQTPPVITIAGVAHGASYSECGMPTPSSAATDATSGIAETSANESNIGNTYAYTVNAADIAGNTSVQTVTYYRVPDTTAPITTITPGGTMGRNDWYVSDVSVGLNATDECPGVQEIRYSVDDAPYVFAGSSTSFILTSDGRHKVCASAMDKSGNTGNETCIEINIDKTPPVISIEGPADGGVYVPCAGMPTAAYSADDATSGVESSNGEATNIGSEYKYTVTATDYAGNRAAKSITYSIRAWDTMQFGRPLDGTGTIVITPKTNRTIPIKFSLFACGAAVTTPTAGLKLFDSGGNEAAAGEFRIAGDQYLYTLDIKPLDEQSYTGIITIDGNSKEQFFFQIIRTK